MEIPFNRPLILGSEQAAVSKVFDSGNFSGNGASGKQCQAELELLFGYQKALLTTSCTSALEFAALLLNIGLGDEVIIPSYAFVTTANAFANRGAKIVFADSRPDHPSIDETQIEKLITSKTKAIVALHYGGVSCEMDMLKAIADEHSIHLIEDNAQGIGSYYKGRPLGGIGTLGALSFHETKNIHCGEGGAILINEPELISRAEIVWDMGTNRKEFQDGKANSYGWVDQGSSFYPSEFNAAFLLAQIAEIDKINAARLVSWGAYFEAFMDLEHQEKIERPKIPSFANHNGHTFYLLVESQLVRDNLITHLAQMGISATFHFQSLHRSKYWLKNHLALEFTNANRFSECLVRLPLFYGLTKENQEAIVEEVKTFFR